MRHLSDG